MTMSRTLIVYLHGIGDNIMLTGVLKEYCRLHPEERVDLVVLNPGCAAIWQGNPLVNSVTVYPARQPHFWNPVKFYLLHQWKVHRYIHGLNHDGRYQRVLFPTVQTLPEIIYHVTGTYGRHKIGRICRDLGVTPRLHPYELHVTASETADAKELLARFGTKRLAVLHPFSGHTKKRLGTTGIAEVIRALHGRGFASLLVGAPNEKTEFDPAWKTESAFGLSFGTLIEVLRRAKVFVGADSAVAHLAAFANTPRIIIFSSKLKPERYLPVSERGQVLVFPVGRVRKSVHMEEFFRIPETA